MFQLGATRRLCHYDSVPVRVDSRNWRSDEWYVLVEDDGLVPVLELLLPHTALRGEAICLVKGGGWPQIDAAYSRMRAAGVLPERVIPVMDADVLGRRGPKNLAVDQNSHAFRFQNDLELSFAAWQPTMVLDHALLQLDRTFGSECNVHALRQWTTIVDGARPDSAHGRATTLDGVKRGVAAILSARDDQSDTYRLPSKVALARACAETCLAMGTLPEQIGTLVARLQSVIAGIDGTVAFSVDEKMDPQRAVSSLHLSGKILLSHGLRVLDVAELRTTSLAAIEGIDWAGWSPDGHSFAGTITAREGSGVRRQVVIVDARDPGRRAFVDKGAGASFRSWTPDGSGVIASVPTGKVFVFSKDGNRPREVDGPGTNLHVLNRDRKLARTTNNCYDKIEVLDLATGSTRIIPDVVDARGGLAWSHDGRFLAFVNGDNWGRRAICVWDSKTDSTRFLTPWFALAQHPAWSPDDDFIAFTIERSPGIFVADARSRVRDSEPKGPYRISFETAVLLPDAWVR